MFLSLSMPVLLYKVLVHTRGYIFFKLKHVRVTCSNIYFFYQARKLESLETTTLVQTLTLFL